MRNIQLKRDLKEYVTIISELSRKSHINIEKRHMIDDPLYYSYETPPNAPQPFHGDTQHLEGVGQANTNPENTAALHSPFDSGGWGKQVGACTIDIPGLEELIRLSEGGSPEVRVAIIDGPVDHSHPALAGARLTVLSSSEDPSRSTHGTHIASVVAGQPGTPVAGIAPNCTVLSIPVYREDSDGNLISCAQTTLARAIHFALDNGATLINISGGQLTPTGQGDRFLQAAVTECTRRNTLIVAAAGNDGCRCLHVPAALPTVLAVGACDGHGRPLPFSNYGDAYRDNGLLAPGDAVPGAGADGSVEARSGTSFATPIVTGVAALLLSRRLQLGQEIDAHAVRRLLLDTASPLDPGLAPEKGRGPTRVLDVEAATRAVQPLAPSGAEPSRTTSTPDAASGGTFQAPRSSNPMTREANAMSANYQTPGHPPTTLLGPNGAPLSGVGPSTAAPDPSHVAPSDAGAAATPTAPATGAVSPAEIAATAAAPNDAAGVAGPAVAPAQTAAATAPLAVAAPGLPPQAYQGVAPQFGVWPQVMVPQPFAAQAVVPQAVPAGFGGPPVAGSPMAGPPAAVAPSGSCGCSGVRPSQAPLETPVFVVGRLFYDFESEARFDYFVQAIAEWRKQVDPKHYDPSGDYAAPWNPEIMIKFLLYKQGGTDGRLVNVPDANALIWTLNIDTTPIYAIQPQNAFGFPMYLELLSLLWEQEVAEPFSRVSDLKAIGSGPTQSEKQPPVERVSQAGSVHGEVRLMNGTVVPQLMPIWRGMYGWNTRDIAGDDPPPGFREFLERIYNQFRNVGVSPQDRAMNYSAFNAYNTKKIFGDMATHKMFLDTVSVDHSTICRPDSDCWDVTWTFFNPTETLTRARKVFQYTVDVSDVVPVTVGKLRDWMIF